MPDLTHFDDSGAARMVDVGDKPVTARMARASARVRMATATLSLLRDHKLSKKGDVLEVARLAGIMAAKKTSELIPLCHPLMLDSVTVEFAFHKVDSVGNALRGVPASQSHTDPDTSAPCSAGGPADQTAAISITATVSVTARTGVEMEALTAASVAALTIYDMCKAVDRGMTIEVIQLDEKTGGRSGQYRRE